MKRSTLIIIICCLFFHSLLVAQSAPKIKFGSVAVNDFLPKVYSIDSSATVVILADIGSSEFEGNNVGTFSILFKNYRRAHILNKNGFGVADVEIPLYKNGTTEEALENLKAVTYNLENGKVVETKLEVKSAVFTDVKSKHLVIRKFTFPNIKEGSIIEYEYKVKSDFIFNLQPWDFQGQYPRLWSEYVVGMPSFYNYVFLAQGYQPFHIKEQKDRRQSFNMTDSRGVGATERGAFSASIADYKWVMKDVPALKQEAYTSTIRNHIARIEFQLQSIGDPFPFRNVLNTWPVVAKELLDDEDFGAQLKRDNTWLKDEVSVASKGATQPLDIARNIYAWVRDNFTCTNKNRTNLDQPLKNVLKQKNGSEAEINLLLVAMLRRANISANPVMLSTRSHGYIHEAYPLLGRFNYVICQTQIESINYLLDASEAGMGFGKLSYECFNGSARIIDLDATVIDLHSTDIIEMKNTNVFIVNNEEGRSIGSFTQVPGYLESHSIRNNVKEKGKESFIKGIKKTVGANFDITESRIDSLDKFDEPVGVYLEFDIISNNESVIYFNPMFDEGLKENPFKSSARRYPVEMPYARNETFNMTMEVPQGYVIDELPKQTIVKYNEEGDIYMEYRVTSTGSNIAFRSKFVINRTYFGPEEYENLREFFNLVVKKHNEHFVFKKKANP